MAERLCVSRLALCVRACPGVDLTQATVLYLPPNALPQAKLSHVDLGQLYSEQMSEEEESSVQVRSREGEEVTCSRKAARSAGTLRHMMEDLSLIHI